MSLVFQLFLLLVTLGSLAHRAPACTELMLMSRGQVSSAQACVLREDQIVVHDKNDDGLYCRTLTIVLSSLNGLCHYILIENLSSFILILEVKK